MLCNKTFPRHTRSISPSLHVTSRQLTGKIYYSPSRTKETQHQSRIIRHRLFVHLPMEACVLCVPPDKQLVWRVNGGLWRAASWLSPSAAVGRVAPTVASLPTACRRAQQRPQPPVLSFNGRLWSRSNAETEQTGQDCSA